MKLSELTQKQRFVIVSTSVSLIFALLLLLAEGAVRLRSYLKYGYVWGVETSFKLDEETGLRIPVANLRLGPIEINSLGFRGPEIDVPKPHDRFRIAFLGGSTTYCAEVSSNEMTWPHLVAYALREEYPTVSFDYVNAAVPGYASESSLKNLNERVAELEPDLIIIYHGTNDLSFNSYLVAQAQGLVTQRAEQERSWLTRNSLLVHLVELNLKIGSLQRFQHNTTDKLSITEDTLTSMTEPFRRDLTALVQASHRVASTTAVATFSVQYRASQPLQEQIRAAETSLYYMPYMTVPGLVAAFDAYNEVIRNVAELEGAILIGGENDIPGDTIHFNDSVHFGDSGSRAMAQRVLRTILANPTLQARLGGDP